MGKQGHNTRERLAEARLRRAHAVVKYPVPFERLNVLSAEDVLRRYRAHLEELRVAPAIDPAGVSREERRAYRALCRPVHAASRRERAARRESLQRAVRDAYPFPRFDLSSGPAPLLRAGQPPAHAIRRALRWEHLNPGKVAPGHIAETLQSAADLRTGQRVR